MKTEPSNPNTKVALVTGAARRIGAQIARTLHQQGFNIVIHYRKSQKEAEQLCNECNLSRPNSAALMQTDFRADLCKDNFSELVQKILVFWGRLDVIINNAASFATTPIGEVTAAQWDELLSSNLKAPFFLAQAAKEALAKYHGCIINLVDIHAMKPLRNYAVYSIAKAGLAMLTKSLAKELAPHIRVNGIAPGGSALWPEGENELSFTAQQQILSEIPLQRPGSPHAIAQAIAFFVEHDYITGQILAVDGGRSI